MVCLAVSCGAFAQENKVNQIDEVTVKHNVNPNLIEVFKIKSTPKVLDSIIKKDQQYTTQTINISSDYIPVIKKFKYVELTYPKNYDSYVYGAAGTYANTEFQFKWHPSGPKNLVYGIDIENYTNQDGIKDLRVKNQHILTDVGVFLGKTTKKTDWISRASYQRNQIHWYGMDQSALNTDYIGRNMSQIYNAITLDANIALRHSLWKELQPTIHFFSDNYQTKEVDLSALAKLNYKIAKQTMNSTLDFQVVNGSFEKDYLNVKNINYNFLNLKYQLNTVFTSNKWHTNIGAAIIANVNQEQSATKFYLLPTVNTSVVLLENIMKYNFGVRSSFQQNTYQNVVAINPYVSPTLNLKSSVVPAEFYMGINGKLNAHANYVVESSFAIEKDKLLFVQNAIEPIVSQSYQLGNSFQSIYKDVNTFKLKGVVDYTLSDSWKIGLVGNYNVFMTTQKVWNLPAIATETFVSFQQKKWFANAGFNLVGNRYDLVQNITTELKPYVDINLKGKYAFTDNFFAHVNAYNLLGNQYERFVNYQSQGIQVLGGITYKF